ncbi:hypothetical protein F2Q68_00034158 [Brassica cretica]|uniref:Uncharacterized protein n=1 Tax=Brassica cretica TaxID=69181 RepID=A0A8S9H0M9_BRACR|nr:hypothetical protein F2Q68_00034158 [Brassica cretica]
MPKIDVTRLNSLRPKPTPSEQPPEPVRTPSDDGDDPMEEDRVSTGRTLRRRKEKVAKHLKRGAIEKEKENFQKRVFRIPLQSIETHTATSIDSSNQKLTDIPHDKSVDSIPDEWENDYCNPTIDAYTRQTSIDTAYYKSVDTDFNRVRDGDYSIGSWANEHHHESFAVETVTFTPGADKLQDSFTDEELLNIQKRDDIDQIQAEAAWERTLGAVCNLQTNQLCLTLIDPNVHYNPIIVKKPQRISRRINDAGIIAACHCGAEYETEYSASIETHTATSIDSDHQKSTYIPHEESVDTSPDDWENDYYNPTIDAYTRQNMHTDEYDEDFEEERAIEYRAILDEEDKLLHHSSCKRNAPSFDMTSLPSIDTQPQQRCRERASTDTAYYKSVKTDFNRVREGDYSIGS